jgi:signal transduction histidine kinase
MELEALKAAASTLGAAIQHEQSEQALAQSAEQLRLLTSQILTAQEKERKRISRELHDELGQALTVMKLNLRAMEKQLPAQNALKENLQQMLAYLDKVIDDVRRLSRDLSPAILEDLGLLSALEHLVNEFSKHYRISYNFDLEGMNHLFGQEAQIIIYRIFQESLTNIAKHARASRVTLAIKAADGTVTFTVEDNGQGFDMGKVLARGAASKGLGLAALHERARMLGGTLKVWSQTGRGTKMTYTIPLPSGTAGGAVTSNNPRDE